MDLLQVIIPEPSNFRILLDDDEEIRIIRYEKIDINFCKRVIFTDGKRIEVQSPLITYRVALDSQSKNQLKKLFSDTISGTASTIQTRNARVKVGWHGYIFNVEISTRPDMGKSFLLPKTYQDSVEICLKLENTNISLFDRANEAYEKYSRFEILDL